jgi:hypothetical protein
MSSPDAAALPTDRVLPATRILSIAIIPFLLAAFVLLYVWPSANDTGRLFAWRIIPPFRAARAKHGQGIGKSPVRRARRNGRPAARRDVREVEDVVITETGRLRAQAHVFDRFRRSWGSRGARLTTDRHDFADPLKHWHTNRGRIPFGRALLLADGHCHDRNQREEPQIAANDLVEHSHPSAGRRHHAHPHRDRRAARA